MVHVYTGTGKGKTTASLGLCLRAWGHGRVVHVVQFMKGRIDYGELLAARRLEGFTLEQFGRPDFVDRENPDPVDVEWAQKALTRAKELLGGPGVDLLVLDEVNVAASWGLIDIGEVV
jgi:cob(I)alamin adenosyltransferase